MKTKKRGEKNEVKQGQGIHVKRGERAREMGVRLEYALNEKMLPTASRANEVKREVDGERQRDSAGNR